MKLRELYEQIDPDNNPEHDKLSREVRNNVASKLEVAIRQPTLDVAQIKDLLISLGKVAQTLPYGPMDKGEEGRLRDEMVKSITKTMNEPTQENLLALMGEWGDFWQIMITPRKDWRDGFPKEKYRRS